MTTVAQARLRDAFARAGYTQEALSAALHVDEPVGAGAVRANASRLDGPLGTLARLFLAGESVPRSVAAEALDVDAAVAAGLLEGEAELTAPFAVDEWQGFYVAHDHEADVAFDHVAGISNATRTLAALTLRRPVRRALDLGTGCGSQALLTSRHAEHVVATDVTERALRVARLNLELNDVTNVELREGSLFEPVEGELFDLIVSQPALRRLARHRSGLSRRRARGRRDLAPRRAGRGGASRAGRLRVDAHLLGARRRGRLARTSAGLAWRYRLRRVARSLRDRGSARVRASSGRARLPPNAGSSTTTARRSAR